VVDDLKRSILEAAGTLSNGSLTLEFARQARSDGQPIDNRFTLVSAIKF
jgi:hypothetical protein